MRKLAAVLVALGGVLILSQSVLMLLGPISVLFFDALMPERLLTVGLYFLTFTVQAGLAVYLIRSREAIAQRLVAEDEAAPVLDERTMLIAGLGILGVFLVADAIPQAIAYIFSPFSSAAVSRELGFQFPNLGEWFIQQVPRLASAAAALAVGIFIVVRRRRLTDRLLGIASPVEDEPPAPANCPYCGAGSDPAEYEGGVNPPLCASCKQRLPLGEDLGSES
jgi:hypothetical protein